MKCDCGCETFTLRIEQLHHGWYGYRLKCTKCKKEYGDLVSGNSFGRYDKKVSGPCHCDGD